MHGSRLAVGTLAFLLAGVVSGQQNQPIPASPLKHGTAVLLGRVVEAGSTTGVAGAAVMINGGGLGRDTDAFVDGTSGGPRRVITNNNGQFVFRNLPAGAYSISTTAVGFVPGSFGQTRVIQFARGLDLVRTLQINENDRLVDATLQMWRMAGISGRVLDEAGEPMINVPVQVLARMTDWGGPTMVHMMELATDDRGAFHADVVPGAYVVGVHAAPTTVPAAAVEGFLQAQAAGGAEFQRYMSGVTSGSPPILPRGVGARIDGFHISQFGNRNAPVVPPLRIDGERAWIYPSTYHPASFTATAATIVSVGPGEEKTGIDVLMRPIPATRVSGRVFGPEGPLANAALQLVAPDPALHRTIPTTLIDNPQALADTQGRFVFLGIPPGAYTLRGVLSAANRTLWTATPITVGETNVSDLEVRMDAGAPIAGRVVFEGTTSPPPDAVKSVTVRALALPGTNAALVGGPTTVRPDASMQFSIRPLPEGRYMMAVTSGPQGWVVKSITAGGRDAIDRPFELTTSGVTDVVVTFTNRPTRLTGIARGTDGNVAPSGTVVAIFPTDKSLWRLPGMQSRRMVNTAPNRDGQFTFAGLPPGEYYLVAADWPSREFADADVITALIPHAQRITLAEAETRHQDLRVVVMR
jgi:protocatechuate 3,4-dioxygenase beta subunit